MADATTFADSRPAELVDSQMQRLRNRQREAAIFSRQAAYDELWDAWQPCRVPDWDGEGADPVQQETYCLAYRLIEALPDGYPPPTITAEPDGCLNFEWYKNRRRLLSVSVSPDATLYWAALVGSEDPRGTCDFFDEFPATLLYWIRRVCS